MSKEAMKLALEALDNLMYWDNGKPDYDEARQAITALREALAQQALDKKAENARELGLDYEPSAGTQVSKVWWDGEKLLAKPIPFVEFYKPAQRTWVGLTDEEVKEIWDAFVCSASGNIVRNIEAKLKEKNNG